MDDKHHCKVGESSNPVTAVEGGKRLIVSLDHKFVVADHDHTKCSIVSSMAMVCNIPQSIDESFNGGLVFVGIKDCIFEPSSPVRHVTELNSILINTCSSNNPIFLIYSDGGPDHRLTYLIVQISYICLFLTRDLDLKLALHSVGLMRVHMSPEYETVIKSCTRMKAIRETAERHPVLREALLDSIEPVEALLSAPFLRLKLKDPFSVFSAATIAEIECFWDTILKVDHLMSKGDRTKKVLQN